MWIRAIATIAFMCIGITCAAPQYNSENELLSEVFANFSAVDFYNTSATSNGRVVNGSPTQRFQLPWHVIINIKRGRGYLCGGSLISSSFVLTEANALRGASSFNCILGAHYSNDRTNVHRSKHTTFHPKHRMGSGNYNIALLKLERAFTDFTKRIHPVQLPGRVLANNVPSYEGRHAWISGFGTSSMYESDCRGDIAALTLFFLFFFMFHCCGPQLHPNLSQINGQLCVCCRMKRVCKRFRVLLPTYCAPSVTMDTIVDRVLATAVHHW